jgi:serine/threonine-protein phosphatase 2B catalytic subunit
MRRGSGDSDTSLQIEHLIKKTLEEDDEESVVEKLADRIAGVRKITGRPRALKRFETA